MSRHVPFPNALNSSMPPPLPYWVVTQSMPTNVGCMQSHWRMISAFSVAASELKTQCGRCQMVADFKLANTAGWNLEHVKRFYSRLAANFCRFTAIFVIFTRYKVPLKFLWTSSTCTLRGRVASLLHFWGRVGCIELYMGLWGNWYHGK